MNSPDTETINFERIACFHCGMVFWVPETFLNFRRLNHDNFCCPAGHTQAFIKPKDDPTVKRLKEEIQSLRIKLSSVEEQLELAQQQLNNDNKQ